MAVVTQVQKKIRMELWDIVKFQISIHCHLSNLIVSDLELKCLTFLALSDEREISEFCEAAVSQKIFGSVQSVRNALSKMEKRKLILKQGKSRKKIKINPEINIQAEGNILLEYKIVRVES